ncbi:MAG: hypothetical protein HKN23_09540, partial [Verrucomicrobiales bacterium]|nr:hypothetical protein [Verrucomicrobiales bacterium]
REQPLFWEWRFRNFSPPIDRSPQLAIREGDWKLLANPDSTRRELYFLPDDPMEVDNRLEDEPDRAEQMFRKLMEWQKSLPAGPADPTAGTNQWDWPGKN